MAEPLYYIDRLTKQRVEEKIFGGAALHFVYGNGLWSRLLGRLFLLLIKNPLFSACYGALQKLPSSKKKITSFIQTYGIDSSEFLEPVSHFSSFNDFFVRRLKPTARPLAPGAEIAIMPADARYRFFPRLDQAEGFVVKGEKFDLATFLEDPALAALYSQGTMVMARLCPSDYHRFHFPCDGTPSPTRFINGWLYSVSPIALKYDIEIFTRNKRTLCELQTERFGKVLYLEIGATNVGSIHETYTPNTSYQKGDEKGYFSFGASTVILLFEPGRLQLDADLLALSNSGLEVRCLMGQSLGTSTKIL